MPGIDRRGVTAYRVHRSVVPEGSSGDVGCIVVVTFETDSAEQATAWIDALAEVGRDDDPAPGMLAAHFHVSTAGTRVLNYAEWVDVAAHQSSVQGRPAHTDVVRSSTRRPACDSPGSSATAGGEALPPQKSE